MNKGIIGVIAAVVILGGVAFFAYANMDSDQDSAENEPVQSSQISEVSDSNAAAGTSLAGSPDSQRNDTPGMGGEMMPGGEQDSNYTIDMFNFGFSIEQIKAKPGETITVELTNSGGTHDFVIDELGVQSDVISTGGNALVTFTVPEDAAGKTFEYYCSIGNHRAQGMVGTLTVK